MHTMLWYDILFIVSLGIKFLAVIFRKDCLLMKIMSNNKKAYHDYFVLEKYECGIALYGTEVKSIRQGKCNIKDSFAKIENNEIFVYGMHVSPYEQDNIFNRDELRIKKLLLHKNQIVRLKSNVKEKGYSLIPLSVYFTDNGKIKLELGLCKGKKLYDKRETLKKKDMQRDIERTK